LSKSDEDSIERCLSLAIENSLSLDRMNTYVKYLVLTAALCLPCFLYAQTDQPNLYDLSFDRFSFKEYDLAQEEAKKNDVMFCGDWCYDMIVTVVDTLTTHSSR